MRAARAVTAAGYAQIMRALGLMTVIGATLPLGCDIGYGVSRSARLAEPIDVSCVPRALRQVPGVVEVRHQHVEPNTCSWPHPTDTIDQFVFSGDKIWGVVSIGVAYNGSAHLDMYHSQINRRPPQDVIDRTREAMSAAEVMLKKECKDLVLTSGMKETCHRVSCAVSRDQP